MSNLNAQVWDGIAWQWSVGASPPAGSPPEISSFSQSSQYSGTALATVENMSDGDPSPFAATTQTGNEWIKATLAEKALVSTVTIGTTTTASGWGPNYTNGAILQVSGNGTDWVTAHTLSGYVAPNTTYATADSRRAWLINYECTHIRIFRPTGYVAIGEFTIT